MLMCMGFLCDSSQERSCGSRLNSEMMFMSSGIMFTISASFLSVGENSTCQNRDTHTTHRLHSDKTRHCLGFSDISGWVWRVCPIWASEGCVMSGCIFPKVGSLMVMSRKKRSSLRHPLRHRSLGFFYQPLLKVRNLCFHRWESSMTVSRMTLVVWATIKMKWNYHKCRFKKHPNVTHLNIFQ